jgi:hypothetical protein
LNWIWSRVVSVFEASIAALSVHSPAGADSAQRPAPDWSPMLSTVIGLAAAAVGIAASAISVQTSAARPAKAA